MVDPGEMRERARRVYRRRRGDWVRELMAGELGSDGLPATRIGYADADADGKTPTTYAMSLNPPTGRDALRDIAGVGEWVSRWETYAGPGEVTWKERRWQSLGTQRIPVGIRLDGIEAIARAARCWDEWRLLASRAHDLVGLATGQWDGRRVEPIGGRPADDLPKAAKRLVSAIAETSERDWGMTLMVLRWLDEHRGLSCYIRELPIRGIDTKWVEGHGKLVLGLAHGLLGLDALPFKEPPGLIRVRALGAGVLPEGFEDASLTATELSVLAIRPCRAIVCENLISMLTMPAMAGTLALFGSGYGVGSRLAIPWLDEVELYYWGDLDTHGFRILDGFRKHHPKAVSVLMDERTLEECEDLWVAEPSPYTGVLPRLTSAEAEVFDFLRKQHPAPRLEQERIPYHQVRAAFDAIASDHSIYASPR